MQKLKNILGSRKKGAQEPHAGREPRYDYQGNTTSNLKGISLERLTLPAGITSYCMCPLFFLLFPSNIEDSCLILSNVCACFCLLSPFRELGPDAGWVQESGRCSHQYGLSDQPPAAPAYWWAGRLLLCICQLVCSVFLPLYEGNMSTIDPFFKNLSGCAVTGLIHPEPCRHYAEYWEHHRGTRLHIPAAGTHGQRAGRDRSEVRWSYKWREGGGLIDTTLVFVQLIWSLSQVTLN